MEILVIILAELLTPILIPVSSMLFALIGMILYIPFLILELVFTVLFELFCKGLSEAWKSRRKIHEIPAPEIPKKEIVAEPAPEEISLPASETTKKPVKRKRSLFHKVAVWSVIVCSSFLVLLLLVFTIVNTFFFESLLRYALRQAENRTNIAVAFDKAEGSFWAGRVRLDKVTVQRKNHKTSQFDLQGECVEIDLSMVDLLRYSFVFESVHVSKFSGTWEQVGKSDKLKPRRNFRIDRLLMDDIQLDFTDRTRDKGPFQVTIKLDTLESSPLRSQWAVFDVLFRSRGRGSVNNVPFTIDSEKGKHSFRMNDVPVELLAHYVGTLDWFDEGKVDLLIEDKITNDEVAMHWSLVFHDFHVKAPEETPLKIKAAMLPLTGFLNLKSKRLPLEFDLQLKENEFRFKSTTELNDVARIVLGDKIMDGLKKIKDKFKKEDGEG